MKLAVGAGHAVGKSCMVASSAATDTGPSFAGVYMKASSGDGLREDGRRFSSSRFTSETTVAFEGVSGNVLLDLVEFRSADEAYIVPWRPLLLPFRDLVLANHI